MWPALLLSSLVLTLAVPLPYWDQWALVPAIQKWHNGSLSLADLAAAHNEHRLLVPRAIMLGLAWLTRWDTRAEIVVNLLLGVAIFLALRRLLPEDDRLLAWIVFTPAQWQNWLWGWQMQIFLCVLALVVAVGTRSLAVSCAAALTGSWSLASGLFIWPIVAARLDGRRLAIWGSLAAAAIALYFWDMPPSPRQGSLTMVRYYPGEYALYVLAFLGGFFQFPPAMSAAAGAALLAAWAAGLRACSRETLRQLAPWHAIAAFALLNALAAGVSRLKFGYEQATTSRYVTVSMLFAAATAVVVRAAFGKRQTGAVLAALFCLGLAHGWTKGTFDMIAHHRLLRQMKECVTHVDSADIQCLLAVYEHVELLAPRVRYLAGIGWGGVK